MTTCAKMPSWSKCLSKSMSCSRQNRATRQRNLNIRTYIKWLPSPQLQASLNSWPTPSLSTSTLIAGARAVLPSRPQGQPVSQGNRRGTDPIATARIQKFPRGHGAIPSRSCGILHRELRRSGEWFVKRFSIHTKHSPPSRSWATY